MDRRRKDQEVQKELESISPLLAKLRKKESGFVIPENYFQDLPEEILEKARTSSNATVAAGEKNRNTWLDSLLSTLQLFLQPRYAMTLAAVSLLIVAGLFWLRPDKNRLATEIAWSDISTEEMTKYVEANIDKFEVSSLVELAPDIEGQSILHNSNIGEGILDGYLEEFIDEVDLEDLENLF